MKLRTIYFSILFFTIFLSSCHYFRSRIEVEIPANYKELLRHRGVVLYGGSGLSISEPLIIKGATSVFYGMEIERIYLEKNYPKYIMSNQYLYEGKNTSKVIDCIEFFVAGGEKKKIYFDISEFYGK